MSQPISEHFVCAVCGRTTDPNQHSEWGGADMCQPCAQSCEEQVAACDHAWEPHDGGSFCGKCSAVKEGAPIK